MAMMVGETSNEVVVEAESVDGVAAVKVEYIHVCSACDSISDHFRCRCPKCGTYNSLEQHDKSTVPMRPIRNVIPFWEIRQEQIAAQQSGLSQVGVSMPQEMPLLPEGPGGLLTLGELEATADNGRLLTGEPSLDFVLGGGMMEPSVIMIGGDPGVGRSTLLTAVFGNVGMTHKCYYAAGEEAPHAIAGRVKRVAAINDQNRTNCVLRRGSSFKQVMTDLNTIRPKVVIFDSLQAHIHEDVDATAQRHKRGSAAQVVPMAKELHTWAHANQAVIWIVCHVTKSGDFAGPNTVDHDVDANIMLTRCDDGRIAATSEKNRFGATDVVGFFAMRQDGLKSV